MSKVVNKSQIIGKNLKTIREKKGITRPSVASSLGVIPQTIYDWESGRTRLPAEYVYDLALCLDCSITDILIVKGEKNGKRRT